MGLLRRAARKIYLRSHRLADDAWDWARDQHPILARLSEGELASVRDLAALFLREKTFQAADGLELTDEMRVSISVQAALPVAGLGIDWYDNWTTVVVVPDQFEQDHESRDRAGVVHEWTETDAGMSWEKGPVVLSWEDVEASGWGEGFNVVIHEAAHRLDMTDGSVNGRPALHRGMKGDEWFAVCSAAYHDLAARSSAGKRVRIDRYATVSDAEFFAVMTEYFFERPSVVRSAYPDVYRLFVDFYRQDPAGR